MNRLLFLISLLVASLVTLNCQSYTTGLEQNAGRADEGAVFAQMRAITRAQSAYSITNANEYGTFEQLAAGSYLDGRFNTSGPKFYGYVFTMSVTPKTGSSEGSYRLNADPDPELKGTGRHFYIDSNSSRIHVNATQPASETDETVAP
ncbi:MAG TPA: hypothetical protein VNO50_16820 [Pyrinomonadaceae bacterium]|nr:hypothetical protein [Pyrinomonadaceae bacterium]